MSPDDWSDNSYGHASHASAEEEPQRFHGGEACVPLGNQRPPGFLCTGRSLRKPTEMMLRRAWTRRQQKLL